MARILRGRLEHCYGIIRAELPKIDFGRKNAAIIYAPNGVMKTSLARVFMDIRTGNETRDELIAGECTDYEIRYGTKTYRPSDAGQTDDHVYVIQSFDAQFISDEQAVTTLLADAGTRKKYDDVVEKVQIEKKKELISQIHGFSQVSVREDEDGAYEYWKNNFNPNPEDCCNLRKN